MKTIKNTLLALYFLLLSGLALAAGAPARLTLEPLFGTETAIVRYPEPPRYVTRAMYGGRVVYGVSIFSGEAEYSEARSRKDYPALDQKVDDTSKRLSLGIRSTLPMGRYLGFQLRAGGRASEGETKITTAGVEEVKENPRRIDPYAGAGLQLAFSTNFALNAGVTMVRNSESEYDSQYTLGLSVRFGKF